MRKFLIAALATSLLVPTAVVAQNGALAPGKPAGVRAAQMDRTGLFIGLGAVAVLATVAVVASDCCQHSNAPVVVPTVTTQP